MQSTEKRRTWKRTPPKGRRSFRADALPKKQTQELQHTVEWEDDDAAIPPLKETIQNELLISEMERLLLSDAIASVMQADQSNFRFEAAVEKMIRESAQRLAVPYVSALEAFCVAMGTCVREHPELAKDFQRFSGIMSSSHLLSDIPFAHLLSIGAQLTRDPKIQPVLGSAINQVLRYSLSFLPEEEIDKMQPALSELHSLPIPELCDTIDYLKTLAAQSTGVGFGHAPERIHSLLESIAAKHREPFVLWMIQVAQERIERERKNPSSGVVELQNNPANARDNEPARIHDRDLASSITLEPQPDWQTRMKRIASDTVGVFDHAGVLRSIGRLPANLPEPYPLSQMNIATALHNIRVAVEREAYLMQAVESAIFCDKAIASVLTERIPEEQLNLPYSWQECLDVMNTVNYLQALIASEERELQNRAGEECEQVSAVWMQSALDVLAQEPEYAEQAETLRKKLQDGFVEEVFTELDRLSLLGDYATASAVEKELARTSKILEQVQLSKYRDARTAMNERALQMSREHEAEFQTYQDFVQAISTHHERIANVLQERLRDIQEERTRHTAVVHTSSLEAVAQDPDWNMFSHTIHADTPLLLQYLYAPPMQQRIETELAVHVNELPFRSQLFLLQFLSEAEPSVIERARTVAEHAADQRGGFYSAFLVAAEHPAFAEEILSFMEQLAEHPAVLRECCAAIQGYTVRIEEVLDEATHELDAPKALSRAAIIQRLHDFFEEAKRHVHEEPDAQLSFFKRAGEELSHAGADSIVKRTMFRDVALALGSAQGVQSVSERLEYMQRIQSTPESRELFFTTLQTMGHVRPIPEIHWRVDRSMEEIERRIGFSFPALLELMASPDKKKTLVEFGPGNGLSKRERSGGEWAQHYQDIAIANVVYYPLQSLFERMIDFQALEKETHAPFSAHDRAAIAEFVYKAAVIQEGGAGNQHIAYDDEFMNEVSKNVDVIMSRLPEIQRKLAKVDAIPTTLSARDEHGQVYYPHSLRKEQQHEHVQQALELLSRSLNSYITEGARTGSLAQYVDVYPQGIMIGDFSQVSRLPEDSIDVGIAVRSTVYKKGEEFEQFLADVAVRMREGGVYIDDSIRDNDGYRYRFPELAAAVKRMDKNVTAWVIVGAGFRGEDASDGAVPLSFVLAKGSAAPVDAIAHLLQPGCELHTVESVLKNQRFLRSLDAHGRTLQELEAVVS